MFHYDVLKLYIQNNLHILCLLLVCATHRELANRCLDM